MQISTLSQLLPSSLAITSGVTPTSVVPDPSSAGTPSAASAAAAPSGVPARTTLLAPATLASIFSAPAEAAPTGPSRTPTNLASAMSSSTSPNGEANPNLTTDDIDFVHAATGVNFVRQAEGSGEYLDDSGAPVSAAKARQAIELAGTIDIDRARGAIKGQITSSDFNDIAARFAAAAKDPNSGYEPLSASITDAANAWFASQSKTTQPQADSKAG